MPPISQEQVLMQQNFDVYLGDKYTRVALTGLINGTNTDFYLTENYYPIYPGELRITPTIDDIVLETEKDDVYTTVAVASLLTTRDDYGNEVFAGVRLAEAPEAASVDSVVGTGRAQFAPVVCQSFEMPTKQKMDDVEGIGTTDVIYGFGSIKQTFKADLITSKNTILISKRLFYISDTTGDEVEPGFDAGEMVDAPKILSGFMAITDPQDETIILGFYKFEQVMISPDTPGIKQGKAGDLKLEATIGAKPRLLTPQVEGSTKSRTRMTMTPKSASAGAAITNLTAVLEDGEGNLISGKSITFIVDGVSAGTATTNSSGIATLATYTPSPALTADSYTLIAEFLGDTAYAPSNDSSVLVLS